MSAFRTKQNIPTTMENPVESLMVHAKAATSNEIEMKALPEKKQAVVDPSTRRNCDSAQVYFLDYYFDLLTYLHERKERTKSFKENMQSRQLNDDQMSEEWKHYCGKERAYLRKRRTRTRMNQFQVLAQVGQGGYGAVYLARKKDTKEICALKKMSKKLLMKQGEVQHILTERDILTATKSPWLVKLLYAFQDPLHVYLAMEYVPGGDVRTLLNNSGVLRECHARFYAAEMILAVNALHGLGYIHRDLKPENFLIDAQGHIRLTDFGLSKGSLSPQRVESMKSKLEMAKNQKPIYRSTAERKTIHKSIRREDITFAFSLVGSPDYMAPEILQAKGYDYLVDYWSLGTIFFEFLCGYPPFAAPTMEEVWVNVYHWEKVLERPIYTEEADLEFNLSDEAWNVITGLVTVPSKRISSLKNIQSLDFFRGFDWDNVREIKTPPFKPNLRSEDDTSYFDDFSNPEDMEIYKEVYGKQKQLEESLNRQEEGGLSDREKKKNRNGSGTSAGGSGGVLPRTTFVGFTFRRKPPGREAEVDKIGLASY